MRAICLVCIAPIAAVGALAQGAADTTPFAPSLYLDGGGWWTQRQPVDVRNDADAATSGVVVEVRQKRCVHVCVSLRGLWPGGACDLLGAGILGRTVRRVPCR